MKVYAVERCGNILGIPGRPPDNRWRVVAIFKTKKLAQERLDSANVGSQREWSHFQITPMVVECGKTKQ